MQTLPQVARRRARDPRLAKAELLGSHFHRAANGTSVNIWHRGNSYLARGYYGRAPFGETLGNNPRDAAIRLMEVITEIGKGTYVFPILKSSTVSSLDSIASVAIRSLIMPSIQIGSANNRILH